MARKLLNRQSLWVIIKTEGTGYIKRKGEFSVSNATERPNNNWKTRNNSFNLEINGDSSKNYFGGVLMIESNLEWAEQYLRSKEILLSSLAMKVYRKANMEINQMYRLLGRIE